MTDAADEIVLIIEAADVRLCFNRAKMTLFRLFNGIGECLYSLTIKRLKQAILGDFRKCAIVLITIAASMTILIIEAAVRQLCYIDFNRVKMVLFRRLND